MWINAAVSLDSSLLCLLRENMADYRQMFTWLDGVKCMHDALPSESRPEFLQKQGERFTESLDKFSLQVQDAMSLTMKLQEMKLWEGQALEVLVKKVSGRICAPCTSVRKQTQDYTNMPNWLTALCWAALDNNSGATPDGKLAVLMTHLTSLGLRFPSEPTYAMICVLLNPDIESFEPHVRHQKLLTLKPSIKHFCDASTHSEMGFDVLPADPKKHADAQSNPTLRTIAFAENQIGMLILFQKMRSIPLRCSNKHSKGNGLMSISHPVNNVSSSSSSSHVPHVDLMGLLGSFMASALNMPIPNPSFAPTPRLQILSPRPSTTLDQTLQNARDLISTPQRAPELPAITSPDAAAVQPERQALQAIEDKPTCPLQVMAMLKKKAAEEQTAAEKKKKKKQKNGSQSTVSEEPQQKPAMKKQQQKAAMKKHAKKPTMKKQDQKAAMKKQKQQDAMKELKKVKTLPGPSERLKLRPLGCGKCRKRPGCCDSCWLSRKPYKK